MRGIRLGGVLLTASLAAGLALAEQASSAVPESGPLDPVAARAMPLGPLETAKALRLARDAWDGNDPNAALEGLQSIEAGLLADHVWLLRASWLHARGALDEAVEATLAALAAEPPSEVRAHAYQTLARIQLDRGDLPEAYRAQEQSWKSSRSPTRSAELRVELARAFEERQLPGDALRLYRETWSEGPIDETTRAAYLRSRELTEATGAAPPPAAVLAKYAGRLKAAFRCSEALPLYDQLLASGGFGPRKTRTLRSERARCLFNTRKYEEAAKAYEKILKHHPKDFGAAIQRARSLGRGGRVPEAVEELDRIAKRAGPVQRARCQYLIALLLSERNPKRAQTLMRTLEKQKAAPGYARLARWHLAWSDYLEGKYATALRRLRPLARGSLWDIEVQRARYWIAVGKSHMNDPNAALELGELAQKLPLNYYGMLAADRLGLDPEIERSVVGEPRGSDELPLRVLRARTLIDGGLPDSALAELESFVRARRLDRHERLATAELFHELGDHFRAVRLVIDGFGGTLEQGVDPDWREAWHSAWPRPFDLSVRSAVEEFDFDAALVYAIMREESTYRPGVASPAGALGLMQIIPPTGSRIAGELGIAAFDPEILLQPDVNIRFGTFYLRQLVERFEGERPFAIAAYNAGPEAVSRWLSSGSALHQDTFVDSVPYGETRRYCRRVLRSYRVYRMLYGTDAPRETTPASEQKTPTPDAHGPDESAPGGPPAAAAPDSHVFPAPLVPPAAAREDDPQPPADSAAAPAQEAAPKRQDLPPPESGKDVEGALGEGGDGRSSSQPTGTSDR